MLQEMMYSSGEEREKIISFDNHINKVTTTIFCHLNNISNVRKFLSQTVSDKLVHTIIWSGLENGKAVFAWLYSLLQLHLKNPYMCLEIWPYYSSAEAIHSLGPSSIQNHL